MKYNLVATFKSNVSAMGKSLWNNGPYFVAPIAAGELWGWHGGVLMACVLLIGISWIEKLIPKGTTIHMHVDGDVDLTDWKAKV